MIERLTKVLRPERVGEEEAIEALAKANLFNDDLLVEMIERAAEREYLSGVHDGTKKIVEVVVRELSEARAHDMA